MAVAIQISSRHRYVIISLVIAVITTLSLIKNNSEIVDFEALPQDVELEFSSNAILSLARLSLEPPPAPVSPSCSPPSLPPVPSCQGNTALTGHYLVKRRRLVLMMLFSFEVDTLEISLREQHDWVDMIFIVEATTTTKGERKPLMWERVRATERFSFVNESKIVHVVMDEVVNLERVRSDQWYHELTQTDTGIDRVKLWSLQTGHLEEDDLLISADVDEVMSAGALQALRWCDTHQGVLFGALWMPLGSLDRAYRSEFHLPGRPHTYSQPTIYRWGDLVGLNLTGRRLQSEYKEERTRSVVGGIHLTHPAFLPSALLKSITATEREKSTEKNFFTDFYRGVTLTDLNSQQELLYKLDYRQTWIFPMLVDFLSSVDDIEPTVPWFLACNRERFPYWFGQPDPRNEVFLRALNSGGQAGDGGGGGRKSLYFHVGCYKTLGRGVLPCLSGWERIPDYKRPNDDPGAGAWGKRLENKAARGNIDLFIMLPLKYLLLGGTTHLFS